MKIRLGTFNCENLFMRYRFFYVKKSNKKDNIYSKKYLALGDIPTNLIEPFVKDDVIEDLYDYVGFLPKEEIVRKDGKNITKTILKTLAKNGASNLFDVTVTLLEEMYAEILKGAHNEKKNTENKEKLLEFRIVAMQIKIQLDIIEKEGGLLNSSERKLSYSGFAENQRWNTAKVILANNPDIVALQEVENMEALKAFNKKYLYPKNLKAELGSEYDKINQNDFEGTYPFGAIIDSNDPRMIDVALLSRYPILSVRTHQFERFKKDDGKWDDIFSRDCLEVEIALEDTDGKSLLADYRGKILSCDDSDRILTPSNTGKTITVFANHFKSKLGQPDENPQTSSAWKKRKLQSERVSEIISERFGNTLSGNFVVAGDLNDGPESGALKPLFDTGLWNVVEKDSDPWTHYYDQKDEVGQFDYLLLSSDIKKKNNAAKPIIERRGLQKNSNSKISIIKNHERFETVEKEDTEASDHCGVFVDIEI